MTTVNIHQAKTHLSRLIAEVARGEEVIISRAGTPIARLVPYATATPQRMLGRDRGLFEVPNDFDAPLAGDVIESFERSLDVREQVT